MNVIKGNICTIHGIGYISQCPTCAFEENEVKGDEPEQDN